MSRVPVRPGLFADDAPAPGEEIRLSGSRCPHCSRLEFPAAPTCPNCGSAATPEDLPGVATLVGFTSVRYAPPGARVQVPYTVGVARFGDDLCVMGLVEAAEADLDFGLALRTVAIAVDEECLTYGFRPAI